MSLALGAEAEKRIAQPGPLAPANTGSGELAQGHLLLHGMSPLQVPIASEVHASEHLCRAPHLGAAEWSAGNTPLAPAPTPRPGQLAATVQAAATRARWNPGLMTGLPGTSRAGTQTGGARKWEGPGRGAEKKNSFWPTLRGSRERGMCLQGTASGAAPAGSQSQLFVTGLLVTMAAGRQWLGVGDNKSANC